MSKKEVMEEILGDAAELDGHFQKLGEKFIAQAEKNLNPAIVSGVNWLIQTQNDDGGFGTDKGKESLFHLTAFALLALVKVGKTTDDPVIQKTLAYLRKHQTREGFWPYKEGEISESVGVTGLVIQALDLLNIKKVEEIFRDALDFLKERFVMDEGCWRDHETAEFWEISVNESALSAIKNYIAKKEKAQINKFREEFLEHDSDDGYGWRISKYHRIDGDIENTAIALKILANLGYSKENDTEFKHVEKAINYILASRVRTGGFPPRKQVRKVVKEAEIDATALVISGLVACGYDTYDPVIHSAAQFIMNGINFDGGWGDNPNNDDSDTDSTALAIIALVDAGKGAVPLSEVQHYIVQSKEFIAQFIEKHVEQLDRDLQHANRLNRLLELNMAVMAIILPIVISIILL